MSLIFATQLTAVATAVLAVFAFVTAWYARRAFLKQSQEVSDQAEMLKVQSEQLTEQRNHTPRRHLGEPTRKQNPPFNTGPVVSWEHRPREPH